MLSQLAPRDVDRQMGSMIEGGARIRAQMTDNQACIDKRQDHLKRRDLTNKSPASQQQKVPNQVCAIEHEIANYLILRVTNDDQSIAHAASLVCV